MLDYIKASIYYLIRVHYIYGMIKFSIILSYYATL